MSDNGSNKLAAPPISEAKVDKEQLKRRRILVKSIILGILVGLFSCLFRMALHSAEAARIHAVQYLNQHYENPVWPLLVCLFVAVSGIGIAVWFVRCFCPESSGSGIPHLKSIVLGPGQKFRAVLLLPVKFLAGVIGIGSGLALGREGPTIQMGGAIGEIVSRGFKIKPESEERRVLISAGAAAGLSGAFNAPLSAMLFVLEELYGTLTPIVFVSAFLASITSDIICQMLMGPQPVFMLNVIPAPTLNALPVALLIGLLCGLGGVCFNTALLQSLNLFDRFKRLPVFLVGIFVGLPIGFICWINPELVGAGVLMTEDALHNAVAMKWLLVFLLVRFVLTILSYGSGAAGGIFTPVLVLGALGGLGIGNLSHLIAPGWAGPPEVFAVLGMGALFTAVVRAPLTGIVLMIELTGKYDFMLPLLLCTLTAYGIAEFFNIPPIYEALRKRNFSNNPETKND